jgi:hypothetical protein
MVATNEIPDAGEQVEVAMPPRRRWPVPLAVAAVALAGGLGWVWLSREEIADDIISGQLKSMGLPATYTVEKVAGQHQVLRNVVVGDPRHPDLTIEQVDVAITYGWGMPSIGRIQLVKPRLYGSLRGGKPTFGSLDKVLFTGSKEPFRLPDLDVDVIDGRARLDSDYGPVGLKLEGKGALRDGFSGTLAAVAPTVQAGDCRADKASLFGAISITHEKPRFTGPARMAALDCRASGVSARMVGAQIDATFDTTLDGGDARLALGSAALAMGTARAGGSTGTATLTYRKNALTAKYDLGLRAVTTPQLTAAAVATEGMVRSRDGLAAFDAEGQLSGSGMQLGDGLDSVLAGVERSAADTLAAPILAQVRGALRREGRASSLSGAYTLRQTGAVTSLVLPQAVVRGGSGATLLSLSRFQFTMGNQLAQNFSGHFTTGGAGLPQIAGRMERRPGGETLLRLTMADYQAGSARLAIPELMLAQARNGALGFAGRAVLSGALPGGGASNLQVPLEGNWSGAGGLSVWRKCTPIRFDSLSLANLKLDRRELTLCPQPGGAILRSDARGLRIAAGAPSLDVTGWLGDTAMHVVSGPVGFAMPGALAARKLDVTLGSGEAPTRFQIDNLTARVGKDIAGQFDGSQIFLAAVPLDMRDATGNWRYANGALTIDGAKFRLEDREVADRFRPLLARDARLTLADNVIQADAVLREPASDRVVTSAAIRHDLGSGRGHADLAVDNLQFDKQLQPDTLTALALGVIANARGSVRGAGRIDWTPDKVTSTGRFTTEGMDFAAAFGPTKGVSGTVEFTDLLGLVTAPDQRLKIASINPGIEANDGELSFALQGESVLMVNGAKWPFLNGSMELLPTRMVLGAAETRRFTLKLSGVDAAQFITRMEMANLSATGTFDGTMPLVFDENGGHIEGGLLVSRPPGGNVSYVGQLTYKDLTPIVNYAFDALRSLDYREMRIAMDGALEGEIVTRVRFSGVKQGQGAKQNFVTRRLSRLPIQFNVNLRAPFYQLITSFKAMYDPDSIRDPRSLGLLGADGKPRVPPATSELPVARLPAPVIQPPVSEIKP